MADRSLLASIAGVARRFRGPRRPRTASLDRPAAPPVLESLEDRVLFALSGSGYSGTLSSNAAIRKQQLICDPAEPKRGSTSVLYDASQVTLSGVIPGPGYDNLGFIGRIEVRVPGGNTILKPLVAWLDNPVGEETGYVQVEYRLDGNAGQLAPPSGYTIVDENGVTGVDTHAFFFDFRDGVDPTTNVPYTIFAANAATFSGNPEDFLISNDGLETRSGPNDLSPAGVTNNQAPTIASTGGPYAILEGSSLTLTGVAGDLETPAASLLYAWDVNNDGITDATGATATLSAAALAALNLNDGPANSNVKLTVTDAGGKSASALTTLSVSNVDPTGNAVAAAGGLALASPALMTLTATDPASPDATAGFTYLIDWGDGTPVQTVAPTTNNGNTPGLTVSHTYAAAGTYTATAQSVDKDGGVSAVTTVQFVVAGARIGPDPAFPGKFALFVDGTAADDVISFAKVGSGVSVKLGALSLGTFKSGFGRIIVRAGAGNDNVSLNFNAASEVVFFGEAGNDTLTAGNFLSILVGGDGNDTLSSGNAKDLLIGGDGADVLKGGDGEDLVVAGKTDYDDASTPDLIGVSLILREWVSGSSYDNRIKHLTGTLAGGLNGGWLLKPGVSVFDDGHADEVKGGNGRDWLLLRRTGAGVLDLSHDLTTGETGTAL